MSGKSAATEQEKERSEADLAKLFTELEDHLAKEWPSTKEKLAALSKAIEPFAGIDLKATLGEIEKLKATQAAMQKAIATNRKGLGNVAGVEDESFSLLNYLVGCYTGDFAKAKAEKEREIQQACRTKAAQQVGDDSLGGFWIPDQVLPDVIESIYAKAAFINLDGNGQTRITVIDGLFGGNVRIPKVEGGVVTYWLGENDTAIESSNAAGEIVMNPHKAVSLVTITDTMRRLGGPGWERMLRRDMVRSLAAKLDWTIPYGTGGNDTPRGILKSLGVRIYSAQSKKSELRTASTNLANTTNFQADWVGAPLHFDILTDMLLQLEEDNVDLDATQTWISSPRAWQWLKNLKISYYSGQTADQGLLLGAPFISDEKLASIIGSYAKSSQITSSQKPGASIGAPSASGTAKATDIFGGNLGEVMLGRWGGFDIEDDGGKGLGFLKDRIYVKLRGHFDVGIRQGRGVVVCTDALVRT